MEKNKYLQLSIGAFITAIVIGMGLVFNIIDKYCGERNCFDWINGILIGISILFGLYFLYKYKIGDSKTAGLGWVNNLVERLCEALPEIPLVLPLILGVIIVTQNITNLEGQPSPDLSTIMAKLSTNGQTLNQIATEIYNMSSCPTMEESTAKCPTTIPIPCVTCCSTPISSDPYTPTQTDTSTQTSTPTPMEITGCVVTHGLNVRKCPGVTETPSNHAKIWLREGACVTILETLDFQSQQWANIRTDKGEEGCVRLNKGETEYVVTVTPMPH